MVLTVANSSSIIKNSKHEALAIAEIFFEGLIRFIGFVSGKIVSWLISKLCIALFWLKFVIENIIDYILERLFSGNFLAKVKSNYLNHINVNKFDFTNLFLALFKGIKATI